MFKSSGTVNKDLLLLLFLGLIGLFLHPGLLFSRNVLIDYDLVTYFYPIWELRSEALRSLSLPLWDPYIFGGVPFIANIQTAVFYPLNWPLAFLDVPKAVALSYLIHLWMAGAFMFLFARVSMRLERAASFYTGMVFMLSGFFAAQVGHINQVNAAAWLPLLFLCLDLSIRRRRPLYMALGGLTLAMQLLAGHPQEAYMSLVMMSAYTMFMAACQTWEHVGLHQLPHSNADSYGIQRLVPRSARVTFRYFRDLRAAFLCLGVIVLLGVVIAGIQLLPTAELARYSIRAGGFSLREATTFSLPPWEVGRALLPAFEGYPPNEYIAYIGFFPLALVVAAIVSRRSSGHLWFFVIILLLGLAMAFGRATPVFEWMYYHLPGVSFLRVPARWLFVYTFAASVLAGLGFSALATSRLNRPPLRTRLVAALSITAIIAALWVVFYRLVGVFFTAPSPYGLALWPLLAGVAMLVAALWGSLSPSRVFTTLALSLTLGELSFARLDLPVYQMVPQQAYTSLRPAMSSLLAQDGLFRYLSVADTSYVPGDYYELLPVLEKYLDKDGIYRYFTLLKQREVLLPNTGMTLKLSSLDGYDGGVLPLKSYLLVKQLLMGMDDETALVDIPLQFSLKSAPDGGVAGLLNVKYLVDDRIKDQWVDGVYYDPAFERLISASSPLTLNALPEFATTYLGVVARLEDGASVQQGQAVARVIVEDGNGQRTNHAIRAGIEIADSALSPDAPNRGALHGLPSSGSVYDSARDSHSYTARIELGTPTYPQLISIEPVGNNKGTVVINAVSLVNGRTGASISVPISPDWKPIYYGDLKIYENMKWLPRVYLATDYLIANSSKDAFRLITGGIEGRVVLDRPAAAWKNKEGKVEAEDKPSYITDAKTVEVMEYKPGKVSVKVSASEDTILVFSESYYPGWSATIDGSETEVLRANQLFQTAHVPMGQHTVEFEYKSKLLEAGLLVTLGGLAITLCMVIASPLFLLVVLTAKRRRTSRQT
ncbi:MAG: hypothetical protein EXR50_00115 [Dehalococcoidia bacterium]|nr:hypothetical protein [Dehalococcoidia bacterium]